MTFDSRFVAVQCELWDRDFKFTPASLLDIPELTTSFNPIGDQLFSGYQTRSEVLRTVVKQNRPLLNDWSEESDEWWLAIEVGSCSLEYLISIEMTGDMGQLNSCGHMPVRLVRPTAAELAAIGGVR
ncbi:hypothetical protein [Anatilimnocola floriformis]|uniref:hypothetical protein n=1 Tax=Anatilimnocola floriformis TaxID=2948575 RepID=UPI0020C279D1|nr:hypothetical protein [Anatilimnocola floriformis]